MKSNFFSFRHLLIIGIFISFGFFSCLGSGNNSEKQKAYGQASVSKLSENQSIAHWWISDPVLLVNDSTQPDDDQQKEFFLRDEIFSVDVLGKSKIPKVLVSGKSLSWRQVTKADGMFDLNTILGKTSFAYAFALTEIFADSAQKLLLGLGSDDGVKVFLNGELVHENWIGRGVNRDDDIIGLNLQQGSNQLLLKVQNMKSGWGFTVRRLGSDKIIDYAAKGDLDKVNYLLENGIDINTKNEIGLTALGAAEITGREKLVEYLEAKGAESGELPSFEDLTSHLFRNAQNDTSPGVAVLVAIENEIILHKGFGFADVDRQMVVTPDTKFRIGSCTKQFTAEAILTLEEAGKLNLEDKLSKFIPDFPRGNEVSIHRLLTHTSGIHSYTDQPDFIDYVSEYISLEALLDTLKTYEYDFDPGEQWAYSNSGYIILGAIIEKVSGMKYADYLTKTFFAPLGMKNSGVHWEGIELSNEAVGYTYEDGNLKLAHHWDMSWAGGAGAIYSTVEDLFLWNKAFYSGKVISVENLEKATSPVILNNGKEALMHYGYGLAMGDWRGINYVHHSGGLHGFMAYLGWIPSEKATIVVLCNATPPAEGINPMINSRSIAEYAFWEKMNPQETYAADTSLAETDLEEYAGRYDYGRGAVLIIRIEENEVFGQLTGQPEAQLFPGSEDELYWKVVEARIKFKRDEAGVIDGATHYQGGREFEVAKQAEIVPVEIDRATLDNFTGTYDFGNGMMLSISRDVDALFLSGDRLPKSELIPTRENRFECREIKIEISFKENSAGEIDKANVNMGGMIREAPRVAN